MVNMTYVVYRIHTNKVSEKKSIILVCIPFYTIPIFGLTGVKFSIGIKLVSDIEKKIGYQLQVGGVLIT